MRTSRGTEKDLGHALNRLLMIDFDAIEAYDAAIERLEDPTAKQQLREYRADHARHTTNLPPLIRMLGEEPAKDGDYKRLMTKGKVAILGLTGDDGVLRAMLSNEKETNEAYEHALQRDDLTPEAAEVVRGNLADERRHKAWLESRLGK